MKLCDVTCSGPAFLIDTFTYIHCELKKTGPFFYLSVTLANAVKEKGPVF